MSSGITIGVVAFLELTIDEGQIGIVMDACQSGNLAQRCAALGRSRWSERELLQIAIEMMRVVGKLHDACIAHGDLVLENWLISRGDCLRLTDFGSAELVQFPANTHLKDRKSLKFDRDMQQIGKNLYQMATARECRYNDNTPRDLLIETVTKRLQVAEYSVNLAKLICVLISHARELKDIVSFAEKALARCEKVT